LIHDALEHNHDLQQAVERIAEAQALVRVTGADRYPRVDFEAGAGTSRSSRNGFPAAPSPEDVTSDLYRLAFNVSWELDVFGRLRSLTAAEQARYLGTVEAHRAITLALVAEVARAYFTLRSLDLQREVALRTVASRKDYVELARVRFEGGKTSELDWRQAETEYFRTDVVRVDLERQIAQGENALSVLLGHAPREVARGLSIKDQPLPLGVPAGLPSDLLARRPDIQVAEQRLAAETWLLGAARANLYPRIALTGAYGVESTDLTNLVSAPSQVASIVGGLLQPVFNAGQNRALVQAQCARMRAEMEAYGTAVLVAFQEVEDALDAFQRFTEARELERRHVEAAARVVELAEIRYRGNVTSYLEVLDAQRVLFQAELDQASVIQGQLVALAALYKALGGGWPSGHDVDPQRICNPRCASPCETQPPRVAPAPAAPARPAAPTGGARAGS
jgi:multidrug efflux system outer membrane protein